MGEKRRQTRQPTIQILVLCTLAVLALHIAGCENRLARMEQQQTKLEAMVAANARQLATVSEQIHVGDGEFREGIERLDQNDRALAGQTTAVQSEQAALREDIKNDHQAISDKMTTLDANERALQDGVTQVATVARRTAGEVADIAREHATLHQMVQRTGQELGDSITAVAAGQQTIRTDIGQLQQADRNMTQQLVALGAGQNQICSRIENLHTVTQTVAQDVTGISQAQTALGKALQDHDAALATKCTVFDRGLESMRSTLSAHSELMSTRIAVAIDAQKSFQNSLNMVLATTSKTAENLTALASRQAAMQQTLERRGGDVSSGIAAVADRQEQLRSGLEVLAATTDQTALGVMALSDGQVKLTEVVQADRREVVEKLTEIAQGQRQWIQRLDAAQTSVQAVATNITAIEEHITSLQGSLQANLDTLAAQLGAGTQDRAEFQARVARDIQAVSDAVSQLRQTQAALTEQMQQIQSRTQSQTDDLMTAIRQLKPPEEVKVSDAGTKLESSVAEAAAE